MTTLEDFGYSTSDIGFLRTARGFLSEHKAKANEVMRLRDNYLLKPQPVSMNPVSDDLREYRLNIQKMDTLTREMQNTYRLITLGNDDYDFKKFMLIIVHTDDFFGSNLIIHNNIIVARMPNRALQFLDFMSINESTYPDTFRRVFEKHDTLYYLRKDGTLILATDVMESYKNRESIRKQFPRPWEERPDLWFINI